MKGIVFNIQRYSVNDGPGIRTLIFFKGCPLRCEWCSNPESQHKKRQIMFFCNLCSRCGACADACPNACITMAKGKRVYNPADCDICGGCEDICPNSAVKRVGEKMNVEEVVAAAERDYLFYLNSGGGATLGGGEPTLQPSFAARMLKELKALDIHTAMETCGYTKWSVFERLAPDLDLLLYDVKHMHPAKHKRHTGKSNDRILNNLKKLLKGKTPVIVRIPVIPRFNDDARSMKAIASFLDRHNDGGILERVDLLPYHKLGVGKYGALGTTYTLDGSETPADELMQDLKRIFVDRGFNALVEDL
ncbi:MAG: glycyl-radical enzyme activating protein [Deltaproteobacteria bacterium]|nr:glycyl-radical enzyme activating protein [Deltaproteobacteria bacterium]